MTEKQSLTKKQRAVYEFIRTRILEDRRPPTVREIADNFHIRSPKGATDHLAMLERKGWIVRTPGISRGIQLADEEPGIPLLGRAAAGFPILAQENILGHLNFAQLFGLQDRYSVEVSGDSMENAGIHDGDYVIIQRGKDFKDGDIVLAVIDGDATIKRIYREEDGRYRLQPENKRHKPIYVDKNQPDFSIGGTIVGVVRRY
ncbi:MAG: transcriptional repressor LexA [Verrucomicrobia bacterium]|nr:transcriptional repressor LexA [Verrucomicrobiota bacterium]MCH8513554.1 transcriptional repressor LexA [Kiritimatiellia bacterium]